MPSMLPRRAGAAEMVRSLASHEGDPVVSTVYLDTDGARRPVRGQLDVAFEQLADGLMAKARARGNPALTEAVDVDRQRMREWLDSGWDRGVVRGIGLFSDSRQGWFEAVPVAWPVADAAGLGLRPLIAPLVAALADHPPLLVALVDRRRLRLFEVDESRPRELPGLDDLEPRGVDTDTDRGGFDRVRAEAARVHYRRSAERVEAALGGGRADRWVLGGPQEAVASLEAFLHTSARRGLVGRVAVGVSAPIGDIVEAVDGAERSVKRRLDIEAVVDLEEAAGSGRGASMGLDPTLRALADRRVGTLLVAEGYSAAGARCPVCGLLTVALGRCPRCGTTPAVVEDVVALAIDEAVVQDADVAILGSGRLDRYGRVAAIDRFQPPALIRG